MNFLKTIGILLLIFVLVCCAIGLIQPKHYYVERKLEINVPVQEVHFNISSWEKWKAWSPWEGADTSIYSKIEGKDGSVGSRYNWKSTNPDVGFGNMKFTDIQENKIEFDINLKSPLRLRHKATFDFAHSIKNTTKVTWSLKGKISFFERISSVFWSMDDMTGQELEKGLRNLKDLLERQYAKKNQSKASGIEEFTFLKKSYLINKQVMKLSFAQAQSIGFPEKEITKLMAYANENRVKTSGAPVTFFYDLDTIKGTYSLAVGLPLDSIISDSLDYSILSIEESKAVSYEHKGSHNSLFDVHRKLKSHLVMENLTQIYPVVVSYDSSALDGKNLENWTTTVMYLHE